MYKVYKRVLLIAVALLILVSIAFASSNKITKKEFKELQEYTSIGGHEIADVKAGIRDFITKIYSPSSQDDIDKSFDSIDKYCTNTLINSLKSVTNSYKEEAKQEVQVLDIIYGSSDTRDSILCSFKVSFNGVRPDAINYIEFYINSEGKLYDYDMWGY